MDMFLRFILPDKILVSVNCSKGTYVRSLCNDIGNLYGCGACLSNMAISPDGNVMPCQSWLEAESSLGNILEVKWEKIWNSNKCKNIRKRINKI